MEALAASPAESFEACAGWREAHPDHDLIAAQQAFFQGRFEAQGEPLLGALATDVIAYFGHSANLLDETGEDSETLHRAVPFHHDPRVLMDQMEAGTTRLEDLAFCVPARPCEVDFHLGDQGLELRVR